MKLDKDGEAAVCKKKKECDEQRQEELWKFCPSNPSPWCLTEPLYPPEGSLFRVPEPPRP